MTAEIKCHSLLPLDEVVRVLVHKDTLPQVLTAKYDSKLVIRTPPKDYSFQ